MFVSARPCPVKACGSRDAPCDRWVDCSLPSPSQYIGQLAAWVFFLRVALVMGMTLPPLIKKVHGRPYYCLTVIDKLGRVVSDVSMRDIRNEYTSVLLG
jgi:hypothetical protein